MARVPLQTVPGVELEAGSEVQFGATSVDPQKDVVTDDIARSGKAMQQFGQVLNKLDDEINDAEATQLSNDYHADVTDIKNRYGTLKGVNAVGTIKGEDGENITVFDQYQNEMQKVLESYQAKASNGTVKYIFEKKASVYTKTALNLMTAHSLEEQRDYKLSGIKSSIELSKSAAKEAFASWNNPNGDFRTFYAKGISDITELAIINGWDTTILEDGTYVSKQFEEEVKKYNMEVLKAVADSLGKSNDGQAEAFLDWLNPEKQNEQVNEIKNNVVEKHKAHKNSVCGDNILSNNGNQNDGDFLSQADTLSCLSSNNSHDNGIGGNVTGGLNSNEVDITNKTDTENIETLNKIRNTSKFYSPESSLNGTLIAQHQPTHLFAIQRLGVEKADSLYTKAKSSIEIDKERFKVDPEYATEINKQIITNYNKLILEAAEAKYGNKERLKLETQIAELEKAPNLYRPGLSTGPPSQSDIINMNMDLAKNQKLSELRQKLEKLEEGDPKYVEKIANDLEIITNGIDYNFNPEEPGIKVDPITGLQPLDVLKAKLKATITDPKELETAIKDLEIKYNKIKNERVGLYNDALEKAQEIAFAEPGGWKKLAAHNINIDDFTEADQEILRNGPPEESDKGTLVKLDENPTEVRDNLNAYRPNLSRTDFLELTNHANKLKSDGEVLAVTIENEMLDLSLKTFKFDRIRNKDDDRAKDDYLQIKQRWRQLIDEEQGRTKSKLTRERKQELLNQVLGNTVMVRGGVPGDWGDYSIPVSAATEDLERAYVKIGGVTVRYYEINQFLREKIVAEIRANGEVPTAQRVAEIWLAKGRLKIDNDEDWRKYNLEQKNLSSTSPLQ